MFGVGAQRKWKCGVDDEKRQESIDSMISMFFEA